MTYGELDDSIVTNSSFYATKQKEFHMIAEENDILISHVKISVNDLRLIPESVTKTNDSEYIARQIIEAIMENSEDLKIDLLPRKISKEIILNDVSVLISVKILSGKIVYRGSLTDFVREIMIVMVQYYNFCGLKLKFL